MDQNAGDSGLPNLVQERQVGLRLHLGAGIENDGGVGGLGGGEDGQIVLHRDAAVLSQYLKGHVLCFVVIGHIPEKGPRQNGQNQKDDSTGKKPLFAPGHPGCFHAHITPIRI